MNELRKEYEWFLQGDDWTYYPDAEGTLHAAMEVDFATLNYITLVEVGWLEEAGLVKRGTREVLFDAGVQIEIGEDYTAQEYLWRLD